jgi:hypothetical protein
MRHGPIRAIPPVRLISSADLTRLRFSTVPGRRFIVGPDNAGPCAHPIESALPMSANPLRSFVRRLPAIALLPALLICLACAGQLAGDAPYYASTSFQRMNPELPRDQARREALAAADRQARDQIRDQVYQLRLNDGRTLGDLAAVDPFIRAVIADNLRAARIDDRTVSGEGIASVTVKMDLAPLYEMIQQYPAHAMTQ